MNNPAHRNPELDFLIGEEALTTST
jgi:actin-related protein 3